MLVKTCKILGYIGRTLLRHRELRMSLLVRNDCSLPVRNRWQRTCAVRMRTCAEMHLPLQNCHVSSSFPGVLQGDNHPGHDKFVAKIESLTMTYYDCKLGVLSRTWLVDLSFFRVWTHRHQSHTQKARYDGYGWILEGSQLTDFGPRLQMLVLH